MEDPQRNLAQQRDIMHARFRTELQARGLPYVEVRGDWLARRAAAIEAVDALLGGPPPSDLALCALPLSLCWQSATAVGLMFGRDSISSDRVTRFPD